MPIAPKATVQIVDTMITAKTNLKGIFKCALKKYCFRFTIFSKINPKTFNILPSKMPRLKLVGLAV